MVQEGGRSEKCSKYPVSWWNNLQNHVRWTCTWNFQSRRKNSKMAQTTSVRGCNQKKKGKVRDVTSTNGTTMSHDIVRNLLSDKCKWTKMFKASPQVFITYVTSGRRHMEWHNQHTHPLHMVASSNDRLLDIENKLPYLLCMFCFAHWHYYLYTSKRNSHPTICENYANMLVFSSTQIWAFHLLSYNYICTWLIFLQICISHLQLKAFKLHQLVQLLDHMSNILAYFAHLSYMLLFSLLHDLVIFPT